MTALAALRGRVAREVVSLRPVPGAERAAARIAVTTLVAQGVLVAAGRIDLAVYATFGAFACVYGGRWPVPGRWRTQARMGTVMVAAALLGTLVALSGQRAWLSVPVTAAATAAAAVVSVRRDWVPPGPFFVTFAVATCASIPATPQRLLLALLVAGATAALAVVLGVAEERWLPVTAPSGSGPPAWKRDEQRLAVRSALALLAAGTIGLAGGSEHAYWAMVSSVAVMSGTTVTHQLARGVQRGIGTAVGLIPAFLLLVAPLPLWAVPVVIAVLQGLVELFVVGNYALALVFITPMALLVGDLAHPQPIPQLLADRLLETLVGVAVGSLAVVLVRDRRP